MPGPGPSDSVLEQGNFNSLVSPEIMAALNVTSPGLTQPTQGMFGPVFQGGQSPAAVLSGQPPPFRAAPTPDIPAHPLPFFVDPVQRALSEFVRLQAASQGGNVINVGPRARIHPGTMSNGRPGTFLTYVLDNGQVVNKLVGDGGGE